MKIIVGPKSGVLVQCLPKTEWTKESGFLLSRMRFLASWSLGPLNSLYTHMRDKIIGGGRGSVNFYIQLVGKRWTIGTMGPTSQEITNEVK